MRTLGDMNWLNDYIGLEYVWGGRDWQGVDCYGLCKMVYKDLYGLELPDWAMDRVDIPTRVELIAQAVTSGSFTETNDPKDGDFVVCYRTKAAHHLGLVFAGGILHAQEGSGVMYEPISRFVPRFTRVVFGAWNP